MSARKLNQTQRQQLRDDIANGVDHHALAAKYGITIGVVHRYDPTWESPRHKPFTPPPPWTDDALCAQVDPEIFFPDKGSSILAAKKVCNACPVTVQCLTHALEHDEQFGVWGGMGERARQRLRAANRKNGA